MTNDEYTISVEEGTAFVVVDGIRSPFFPEDIAEVVERSKDDFTSHFIAEDARA